DFVVVGGLGGEVGREEARLRRLLVAGIKFEGAATRERRRLERPVTGLCCRFGEALSDLESLAITTAFLKCLGARQLRSDSVYFGFFLGAGWGNPGGQRFDVGASVERRQRSARPHRVFDDLRICLCEYIGQRMQLFSVLGEALHAKS